MKPLYYTFPTEGKTQEGDEFLYNEEEGPLIWVACPIGVDIYYYCLVRRPVKVEDMAEVKSLKVDNDCANEAIGCLTLLKKAFEDGSQAEKDDAIKAILQVIELSNNLEHFWAVEVIQSIAQETWKKLKP